VDTYVSHQDYNLFPTSDEQPFFFNLDPGLPAALATLLIVAGAGLALYLLLGLGLKGRPDAGVLVYFTALGVGFMLVEVPLIQRTILLVGSPTLAMAVVLAPLLLGGGLGSLWSSRWGLEKLWQRLALVAALVTALAVGFAFLQPGLVEALLKLDATGGALFAGLALLPLGFGMGIPFANGLRLLGARSRTTGGLAYLWGLNSLASVAGSALAAALAIQAGYADVLLAGSACYALVTLAAVWLGRATG